MGNLSSFDVERNRKTKGMSEKRKKKEMGL